MIDLALLVLRLCLAIVFLAHGAQIALGLFSGPGINGFSQMLSGLGFKPAIFWAYIGGFVPLIASLCLLLGVLTRFSASVILIFMAVAALKVHLSKGFFLQSGGFEYNFVLICLCLTLILAGGGKFSLWRKF